MIFDKLANRFGYELRPVPKDRLDRVGFVLYHYLKRDGTFDYQAYRQIQVAGYRQKSGFVWAVEDNIAYLSAYIRKAVGNLSFGLCHGTRTGKEQAWFRKYLRCEVLGTELSHLARDLPDTIEWDFHQVKPEWVGKVDFIYSNSFDHSYDPRACLNAWMSCLQPRGLCILEHSTSHGPDAADTLDPFGAELWMMPYLVATWSEGRYGVREILPAPKKQAGVRHVHFIVLQGWPAEAA